MAFDPDQVLPNNVHYVNANFLQLLYKIFHEGGGIVINLDPGDVNIDTTGIINGVSAVKDTLTDGTQKTKIIDNEGNVIDFDALTNGTQKTIIVDSEGNTLEPLTSSTIATLIENTKPLVGVESFDEGDLSSDDYTVVNKTELMGISIINNSSTNALTMTINSIDVVVPAGTTVKEYFNQFTEVTITGTTPDFNAYILNTVTLGGS